MDNVFNSYSRKRTFDLCLFSEKKIIIIEAKVHESFNSEQMAFFEKEISYMQSMISLAGYTPPEIMLVYLASSNYFHNMKTFKKNLNPLLTDNYFTWKDLFDHTSEPLFAKANDLYRKTKMNSLIE